MALPDFPLAFYPVAVVAILLEIKSRAQRK